MRTRLVILIILLAALWGGLWYGLAAATRAGVDHWADMRRSEGWKIDSGAIGQSGFPFDVHTRIEGLTMQNDQARLASQISLIDLKTRLINPLSPEMHFPAQTIVMGTPQAQVELAIDHADATAALSPGLMLELKRANLLVGPWRMSGPKGPVLSAVETYIELTQDSANDRVYHLHLDLGALRPGPALRDAMVLPNDLPEIFDAFLAEMTVEFDRPLDRSSRPGDRPQPRRFHLRRANAQWGAIDIAADAALKIDTNGIPEGKLSLQANNWKEMLNLVQAVAGFSPATSSQIESMLGIVARMRGDEDTLDVVITFDRGRMSMGLIPLGPAPRIYLQ